MGVRGMLYWRGRYRPAHRKDRRVGADAAPDRPVIRVADQTYRFVRAIATRRGIPLKAVLDLIIADLPGQRVRR